MLTRGPEGEQAVRDEKGKPVTGGMRVDYVAFKRYTRELMAAAGLIDLEVELLVDEAKRVDAGFAKIERRLGSLN